MSKLSLRKGALLLAAADHRRIVGGIDLRCSAWCPPLLQKSLGFLARGRGEKGKRRCSWERRVADVKPKGVIYELDGRDESGEKTKNESSRLICVDGKQKAKGKEEFYLVVLRHAVCTKYEELL